MALTLIRGGGDPHAIQSGRKAAALALVKGYEAALMALDPSDVHERTWYTEGLQDARLLAQATA